MTDPTKSNNGSSNSANPPGGPQSKGSQQGTTRTPAGSMDNYTLIRAPKEGGHKRMLDVVFEKLRYTIESEWTEGQTVATILETYEDVKLDPPRRLTPEEKEDDLLVEMWKEDVKQHISETRALSRAKRRLYATVWKLLSKTMKNKVTGRDEFEEKNTTSDVLWLVKVVREIVSSFDHTVPKPLSKLESLAKILNFQQGEKMENADYVKGLIALIKVHEQYDGPFGFSTKDMTEMNERVGRLTDEEGNPLTEIEKSKIKAKEIKTIREKAIAMQIIRGACRRRYSQLKLNLSNDYSLKTNKYPDTVEEATSALNVHENNLQARLRKGRVQSGLTFVQDGNEKLVAGKNGKIQEHIQCHKCKSQGHYANQCPTPPDESESRNSQVGGTDVQVSAHVLSQSHQMSDGSPMNHIQLTTSTGTLDPNLILLDSESTVHVFNNKELLTDIRLHPKGYVLKVHSNGGCMDSRMVGRFGDIDVWYNPNSIANILSLALVIDTYRVVMDSKVEHAFKLWLDPMSFIKFRKHNRLFVFDSKSDKVVISDNNDTTHVSLFQTVQDNERMYRRRDVQKAKLAQDVSKALFHPAQSRLEKIVGGNFISNLPITLADVRRAEKIYGPSVPAIKGRTTRQQPTAVQDLIPVGIPRPLYEEYKFVTVCLDLFYVNRLPVFHSISRNLQHRWVSFPSSRKRRELQKAFDEMRQVYHSRGFRITAAHADEEFEVLRNHMLPCHLVCPEPGGHVPEVERSIRTIKEGCRAAIHGLPYEFFPKEMLRGLIRKVILMLNAFPGEHGVSDTLSPRNIIENLPHLDYNSIKIPFGSYIQMAIDDSITNTPRPRTIGCIVLDPVGTNRKYRFMSLESGRRVSGRMVRILPVTDEVIDRVNQLGRDQKQPAIRDGRLLFEWRPGVPFEHGEFLTIDDFHERDIQDDEIVVPDPVVDDTDDIGIIDATNVATEEDENSSADDNDSPDFLADAENSEPFSSDEIDDVLESESDEFESESGASNDSESGNVESESDGEGFEDITFSDDDGEIDQTFSDENSDGELSHTETLGNGDGEAVDNPETLGNGDAEAVNNPDHASLGRGMRTSVPNPKYYGSEFQFLQHSFESLDHATREEFLLCAISEFKLSKKTHLLERYLSGVILLQMSANAGIRKHGKEAEKMLLKEFRQFKNMDVMDVLDPDSLTLEQKQEALGMINILQEKRDHTPENPNLKVRGCADGRKQRKRYTREETASPTSGVDSILLTLMVAAMEGRDVAIADVVGAYLHALMDDFVAMKIVGREAELMCELHPEWKPHLRYYGKNKRATLYVRLKKALYGCVKSALLWYELYSSTLQNMGFEINPYDQCVANATIDGSQCTICWYVDDNLITHIDPAVVSRVITEIEKRFGKMSVTRGKELEFLGMKIRLREDRTVSIDMKDYVLGAIQSFSEDITRNAVTPATRFLFNVREDAKGLDEERADLFHSITAKLLYISKRCRLDIQNAVGFLCTRVSKPDEDDWKKLKRVLQYLRGTIDDKLILGCIDVGKMKSFVDAAFAVHRDMKSHTGGGISWGIGILLSMCQKQKLNTKSSTEAEVVGVSDFLPNMIWARMFLQAQGYEIDENILYQDNESAIKIEKNGSKSCSKRSRHIDMRYFFIKDRLESEEIKVIYCPTECMVADFFTKPLQGKLFHYLKAIVMGHRPIQDLTSQFQSRGQERVGRNGKSVSPKVSSCLNIGRTDDVVENGKIVLNKSTPDGTPDDMPDGKENRRTYRI